MANFTASNLAHAQALLKQDFQNPEMRQEPAPVLTLGRQNSEILIQSHKILRTREDRPIQAYIMTRNMRSTTGGKRMYNHEGEIGNSMAMDLEWITFVDKFQFSLKLLDNNMFEVSRMVANQISQACQNIRNDAEAHLIAYLMSERTQVNRATKNGEWNATNYAFEIPDARKGRFLQSAKSMMLQNHYNGMYDVIADPIAYADAEFHAAQGAANATNYGFQFNGMSFAQSIDLDDPNYGEGVSLFLPKNTYGVLDWIPKQNREGWGDYNTAEGGYGSIIDPVSGLTMAVHGYVERADTSSRNGDTQDVVMNIEISVDLSPNLAPLSNPNETVVFEVAQLAA